MPTDNRPPRIRILTIIIVIMHRWMQAIEDADSAMSDVCRDLVKLVSGTHDIYLIPAGSRTGAQNDVIAAAEAVRDAVEMGQWPDSMTLAGLQTDWEDAVKTL